MGPNTARKLLFPRPPLTTGFLFSYLENGLNTSALDGLHLLHDSRSIYRRTDVMRGLSTRNMELSHVRLAGRPIRSRGYMTMMGGRARHLLGRSLVHDWLLLVVKKYQRACSRACGGPRCPTLDVGVRSGLGQNSRTKGEAHGPSNDAYVVSWD